MRSARSTLRDAARARDTRQRLLDAARMVMVESGLVEAPLADITRRAGVNVALVSYYFGGREGLMLAIAREDADRAIGGLAKLRASNLPPAEKMRQHVMGIVTTYFDRPYLHHLLQKLIREGSAEAMEQVTHFFIRPVAEARQAIIADGIACGQFRPVDSALIGYAIEGACAQIFASAASRRAMLGSGELTIELMARYARSTAELIVGGLRASNRADMPKGTE